MQRDRQKEKGVYRTRFPGHNDIILTKHQVSLFALPDDKLFILLLITKEFYQGTLFFYIYRDLYVPD